jgi:hypothetical protein
MEASIKTQPRRCILNQNVRLQSKSRTLLAEPLNRHGSCAVPSDLRKSLALDVLPVP